MVQFRRMRVQPAKLKKKKAAGHMPVLTVLHDVKVKIRYVLSAGKPAQKSVAASRSGTSMNAFHRSRIVQQVSALLQGCVWLALAPGSLDSAVQEGSGHPVLPVLSHHSCAQSK